MEFSEELGIFVKDFDLMKSVECGQVFRWKRLDQTTYQLYSGSLVCRVSQEGYNLHIQAGTRDELYYWINYLGAYSVDPGFVDLMHSTEFLRKVYSVSKGIHIFKQDPWEATVSFIVSQRNNIPRIQKCIEDICWTAGDCYGNGIYGFPHAEQLRPGSLVNAKLGYRERYIYAASDAVLNGGLIFNDIKAPNASLSRALSELTRIPGIGVKVANCIALFGLGHSDAFPVDIWIQRALELGNISKDEVDSWGRHKGLVQQYLYWYIRHLPNNGKN